MKYIAIIIFVIAASTYQSFGQVIDGIVFNSAYGVDMLPEHDTVHCVMLYSDTTTTEINKYLTTVQMQDILVRWQYGYCVFRFDSIGLDRIYLDADKKPLSKNIVVWQSLEVDSDKNKTKFIGR